MFNQQNITAIDSWWIFLFLREMFFGHPIQASVVQLSNFDTNIFHVGTDRVSQSWFFFTFNLLIQL